MSEGGLWGQICGQLGDVSVCHEQVGGEIYVSVDNTQTAVDPSSGYFVADCLGMTRECPWVSMLAHVWAHVLGASLSRYQTNFKSTNWNPFLLCIPDMEYKTRRYQE